MPSSVTESLRNSSDMHQSADRPTSVYITRLTVAVWPPNSHATMSKRNRPTLPQLIPPTIASTSAIRSIIMQMAPLKMFSPIFFPAEIKLYIVSKLDTNKSDFNIGYNKKVNMLAKEPCKNLLKIYILKL